jgi:transposase
VTRKNHSDQFKAKVALEAIKGARTVTDLCQEFGVAPAQIYAWKKQLEENLVEVFQDKRKKKSDAPDRSKLLAIIGRLVAENDFLAKVLAN